MHRRTFTRNAGLPALSPLLPLPLFGASARPSRWCGQRPGQRCFRSKAVESAIAEFGKKVKGPGAGLAV
ncbi:MAG: hypothetical protein WKG07_49140 [Hymenobacter sp.]